MTIGLRRFMTALGIGRARSNAKDLAMAAHTVVPFTGPISISGYFNNPLSPSHSVKRSGQRAAALGLASER